jgi:hypothetical protein
VGGFGVRLFFGESMLAVGGLHNISYASKKTCFRIGVPNARSPVSGRGGEQIHRPAATAKVNMVPIVEFTRYPGLSVKEKELDGHTSAACPGGHDAVR